MKNPNHTSQGQSFIEYLLLFAAVLVVLVAFMKPDGILHKNIESSVNAPIVFLEHMANETTLPAN